MRTASQLANLRRSGRPKGSKNKLPLTTLPMRRAIAEEHVVTVTELAQQHCPIAVLTLAEVTSDRDAPAASRVAAANSLLDRGFGRAPQLIAVKAEHTHKPTLDVGKLTPDQRETLYHLLSAATPDTN